MRRNRSGSVSSTTWIQALCSLGFLFISLNVLRAEDRPTPVDATVEDAEVQTDARSLSEGQPAPIDEETRTPLAPTVVGCPVPVLLPDGTTSSNAPAPNANFRFARAVYLITPAEAAGLQILNGTSLGAIGWRYSTAPGVVATGFLTVYLQNTTDTTNTKPGPWSSTISGMAIVHQSPSTVLPNTTAPFDITFSGAPPFTYTGGGLYVAFDWQWAGPTGSAARVSCNGSLPGGLRGATSSTSPPGTVNGSNFRPETILTAAVNVVTDASVDVVISLGSVAVPFVGPQSIQAMITNRGTAPLSDLPVTLELTGANTSTETKTIAALPACGGRSTVTFSPLTLSALGINLVQVFVPPDEVVTNNFAFQRLDTTSNLYSYKHPASAADGGVGFTGDDGAFVAEFPIATAAKVTAVHLEFFAQSGTAYKVAIYFGSGGVPTPTPLYVDASNRMVTAPGPVSITLPFPVSVGPGVFYAGIQQTNHTNANLSYDNENPIRGSTFFGANSLPPTSWFDFLPNNNTKLNVGVTLIDCAVNSECNDGNACTVDVCNSQVGCTHTALNCSDNNVCTDDSCVPATGCAHGGNTAPCNDGNACTQTDICQGGACAGSNPVVCTASDLCHSAGVCSPPTGACSNPLAVHVITGDATGDNEFAIYTAATENPGMTVTYRGFAGGLPDAVAVAVTTSDRYLYIAAWGDDFVGQGLLHDLSVDGVPVFSGDPRWKVTYTNADQDDLIVPPPAQVAVAMAATIPAPPGGWVAPAVGCLNPAPAGSSCYGLWGNFPSINQAARWTWYDSGEQISANAPFEPGFEHREVLIFRLDLGATACDDGNACTTGDICAGPSCQPGTAVVCDDNNACTVDACDSQVGCTHTALDCNDSNACTDDSCVPATGCAHANNTAPCNDGNACTQTDICQGGACAGSNPVVCTASDPCHVVGVCSPPTGACSNPAAPNGTACTDGNPCTADACANGACVGGLTAHVITGDATCDNEFAIYTASTENPGMAVTYAGFAAGHPSALAVTVNTNDRYLYIAAWGDGNHGQGLLHDLSVDGVPVYSGDPRWKVTYTNANQNSVIVPPPPAVAAAMAATIPAPPGGWVAPAVGCFNPAPFAGDCYGLWGNFSTISLLARRTWYNSGQQISPNAPFEPGFEHREVLIFRLDLGVAACDDGNACTTGDICAGTSCQPGTTVACSDSNVCTNDSCSPASGCVYTSNTAACNDGNACTINDACGGGACGGTAITAPAEIQNVGVAADKGTYSWTAATYATRYDVVRGGLGSLPVGPGAGDESCFDDLPGATLNDPTVPVLGSGFWYLPRGENQCGNGSYGTQGFRGAPGAPRASTTCP